MAGVALLPIVSASREQVFDYIEENFRRVANGLLLPHSHAEYATVAHTHAGFHAPASSFPSSPVEGDLFYETDTDKLWVYDGVNWVELARTGAWTDYVPVNTNVTVGNGTQVARWVRFGRTIHAQYRLIFGSTTAFTGNVVLGLPVACYNTMRVGACWIYDSGTRQFPGIVAQFGLSDVQPIHPEAGNAGIINATNPFTWTTNDQISFSFTYEANASI